MKSILGMGNALVDVLIVTTDDKLLTNYSLPKGSMQHVDELTAEKIYNEIKASASVVPGGSAANTTVGMAQLGLNTGFLGKVGNDELGKVFDDNLKQFNVKSLLMKSSVGTGRAMVIISSDSERTFSVYLGAAIEVKPENVTPELFEGYDILHIEGYLIQDHNLIEKAMKTAKELGKKVSLDLASYNVVDDNIDFLKDVVKKYADIVFANEEEAKSFTGKDAEEALDIIAGMCEIAIVKTGAKGSLIKQGNNIYTVNAEKVPPVDCTGAGDLYASGFLYGLSMGKSIETCGVIGTICASEVIQVIGPKLSSETVTKIKEKINRLP